MKCLWVFAIFMENNDIIISVTATMKSMTNVYSECWNGYRNNLMVCPLPLFACSTCVETKRMYVCLINPRASSKCYIVHSMGEPSGRLDYAQNEPICRFFMKIYQDREGMRKMVDLLLTFTSHSMTSFD